MNANDSQIKNILDRYHSGTGCISIAMETGIPLAKIVETVRILVCDGQTPKM